MWQHSRGTPSYILYVDIPPLQLLYTMPIQCVSLIYPPVNFKNVFSDNATKLIRSVRRTCLRVIQRSHASSWSAVLLLSIRRKLHDRFWSSTTTKKFQKIWILPATSHHITPHQEVNLQPTILDTLNSKRIEVLLLLKIRYQENEESITSSSFLGCLLSLATGDRGG
jgi:hypothetical protein